MRKIIFSLVSLLGALALAGCGDDESKSAFIVCESTHALCTTAKCEPADGSTDTVSCACDVKTGYSAGQKPCTKEAQTAKGKEISSRYYPIKSYVACSNDRPWAWCLDKPCIVDPNDATKASCACAVTKSKDPYMVVTDRYTDSTCTTDLWSSATVADATDLTDFLRSNEHLKPFDIEVLNTPN